MRISVLGLGRMGAPMASNLITVGHEVTLYDQSAGRSDQLVAKGGRAASQVADSVKDAQVALTMVPGDDAEDELAHGPHGLLAQLPAGAIHLCMSTISLETSRKLALAHAEAGQGYVAAPVFGRPGAAAARQLWIVAGGLDAHVSRCQTIFDALGRGVTRVGPRAELAHALKLGGDLLTAVMIEGLAEVLAYGEKAGLAPAEYLRLLNTAIFKSPMLDSVGGLMVRHSHELTDLSLGSALQELQSVLQASEETAAILPMAEFLGKRLELATIQGWRGQDLTVLSRFCRLESGLDAVEAAEPLQEARGQDHPRQLTARSREGEVILELDRVTHFEVIEGTVCAWSEGQKYQTPWKFLAEVERTFEHIPFVRLHRHILVQPDAALARKSQRDAIRKSSAAEQTPVSIPLEGEGMPMPRADSADESKAPRTPEGPPFEPSDHRPESSRPGQRLITSAWHLADQAHAWIHLHLGRQERREGTPEREQAQRPGTGAGPEPAADTPREAPATAASPVWSPPEEEEPLVAPALDATSHFELADGIVWAWGNGRRYRTHWQSLSEIESAYSQVILLRVQRNILLHPESVVSLRPVFGGRAKITVTGDVELAVGRTATARLKELLGM